MLYFFVHALTYSFNQSVTNSLTDPLFRSLVAWQAEDKLKELEEEQQKLEAKRANKSYKKKSTSKKAAINAGKGKKNTALISANNRYTRYSPRQDCCQIGWT